MYCFLPFGYLTGRTQIASMWTVLDEPLDMSAASLLTSESGLKQGTEDNDDLAIRSRPGQKVF